MDEIFELQKQLREVTQQESVQRLSERNVVDLILKLMQLGKVDLIYTLSGKEYLTPKQLREEVQDEIVATGGRARLDEIATVLSVDISHIERAIADIVAEDSETQLLGGIEVITSWYLDNVAEEANESLQEMGQITMGSLATQLSLPVDIVQLLVKDRIGKQFQGFLSNGVLYTQAYVDREKARVRGVFSALSRSASITQVASLLDMSSNKVEEHVVSLISAQVLPGRLSGGEYVPHMFAKMQLEAVRAFLSSNGFVDKRILGKLQVKKTSKFMKELFSESIELDSRYVQPQLVQTFVAAVDECVANEFWLDVYSIVPHSFSSADCVALCKHCPVMASRRAAKARLVLTTDAGSMPALFVVSEGFRSVLAESLLAQAATAAGVCAANRRTSTASVTAGAASAASTLDDNNNKSSNKKGKGKKKGGRRARNKGAESDSDNFDQQTTAIATRKNGASGSGFDHVLKEGLSQFLEIDGLRAVAVKLHVSLGDHEELAGALIEDMTKQLSDVFSGAFNEAVRSVFQGTTAVRRKHLATIEQQFQAQTTEVQLSFKAVRSIVQLLGSEEEGLGLSRDTTDALQRAFIMSDIHELLSLAVKHYFVGRWRQDGAQEFPKTDTDLQRVVNGLWEDPGQRNGWFSTLDDSASVKKLMNLVLKVGSLKAGGGGGDIDLTSIVDTCADVMENTIPDLSLVYRKLDRKLERSVTHGKRQVAFSEITLLSDADKVFWLASRIVIHQLHAVWLWPAEDALVIPRSGIEREEYRDAICGLLKAQLTDEHMGCFEKVAAVAREATASGEAGGYTNTAELPGELLEQVRAIVALKHTRNST